MPPNDDNPNGTATDLESAHAVRSDLEQVREDLRRLKEDVARVTREGSSHLRDRVETSARNAIERVDLTIQERPMTSMLVSAGAGILLGMMLCSSRHD